MKTTGALDIVPGVVVSVMEGSRRLAYSDSPAFTGLPEVSEAIEVGDRRLKTVRAQKCFDEAMENIKLYSRFATGTATTN